MSQYSSIAKTPGGSKVNSVLNTVSNTITITATAPGGTVGRVTIPINGDIADAVVALRNQWTASEIIAPAELSRGLRTAVIDTVNNVKNQSSSNIAVAQATGTPPPNEGSAIPVNSANDPNLLPATSPPIVPEAQEPINPNSDPNTNIGAEAQDFVYEPLQEPPIPEADEFTGIDEQIQRQQQINDGTLEFAGIDEQVQRQRQLEDGSLEFAGIDDQIAFNENTLQEPPQLSDEEVNDYLNQIQNEQIENYGPADIEENVFDPGTTFNAGEENIFDPTGFGGAPKGITSSLFNTRSQATQQDSTNAMAKGDWRVRLSLGPGANYLYKGVNAGILAPLQETGGVLFPYTPSINVNYAAAYDASELVHSNYKNFQYRASSVDSITITCDFTAQDTKEARYVLAVIHFFRSVTKMFYGQDQNPKNGTPPPLCYLTGMGQFQFDRHPLAITAFNLALPTDVDYIRASSVNDNPGVTAAAEYSKNNSQTQSIVNLGPNISTGGLPPPPQFNSRPSGTTEATYVPTKIGISISAIPINSRNSISNEFSLRDYGSGKLLRGSKNRSGTGMW
jgi:hypothetical protein